jgi:O-antigen/teichoic acid export membrane protein
MNASNNKNLLKLAICAILLISNIGNTVSIVGTILNIVLNLVKSPVYALLGVSVFIYLIGFLITIWVFFYFYKHLDYIFNEKSLNKQLLINTVIYPIAFLVKTGIEFLNTQMQIHSFDSQVLGEYFKIRYIIMIVFYVLNVLIMPTLAIIVLVKNPIREINNEISD